MQKSSDNPNSKVPYDPGWNDPPTFAYNSQQVTPTKPRNFLNKRVAFPLSGGPSPSAPPVNNMPPTTMIPPAIPIFKPNITPTPSVNLQSLNNYNPDMNISAHEVKNILLEFLNVSVELGSKAADIKRRIDVMEEMWNNGKLKIEVQIQLRDLAYALRDDQPTKADDIHKALIVDHINEVGSWMPAIKQLVHHCIARSELLAIDKDS